MSRGMEILSQSPYYVRNPSFMVFEERKETKWTAEENKQFENALALFDEDTPDRWQSVAAMIPGKTVSDVIKHYRELEEDVSDIEAGLVPVPGYISSDSFTLEWMTNQDGLKQFYGPGSSRSSTSRFSDQEKKKGIPWTEEEHRQFLLGLKKYGKGDWRNISRNFVTSRTPTQVASHAQKYFIRQLSGGKDKRRSSIHDITTVDLTDTTNRSPSPPSDKTPPSNNSATALQALQQLSNTNHMSKALPQWSQQNQETTMDFHLPINSPMMPPVIGTTSTGTQYGQYYSTIFQENC